MSDSISIFMVRFVISHTGASGFLGVDNSNPHNSVPFAWADRTEAEAEVTRMQELYSVNTYEVVTIDPRGLTAALGFDATLMARHEADIERLTKNVLYEQGELATALATITDLRDTNVTLSRNIEALHDQLRDARQHHQDDLDIVSRELNDEADARSWCDEYDEGMRSLDRKLRGNLTFRSRDYDVTTRYTFDITHRVTATSSDDAEADELGKAQLIDKLAHAVRHGEYDSESPNAELAD